MSDYTMTITLDTDLAETEERVRAALAEEGFGILSEIDVQSALQDKLGEDVGPYKILGACNPPLASKAIAADADIGALLPCNVLLRASANGGTDVVAADPLAMLRMAGDDLAELGEDARGRIERALGQLSQ
ncbi:hypothetical protein DVS28_a2682 [Euzebya pacifica]|uniref:DUF302 domain-containing protein n=1 Tax=Euzebya pacifica TaxID=1608957 RepID=A0A346XYR4_9ACTN|nr:DUF302 domain-containing protein [Euzebya pacifica]AXV07361.1 hypothetical protein DVS28_a2682 [Euzebya pacifica]